MDPIWKEIEAVIKRIAAVSPGGVAARMGVIIKPVVPADVWREWKKLDDFQKEETVPEDTWEPRGRDRLREEDVTRLNNTRREDARRKSKDVRATASWEEIVIRVLVRYRVQEKESKARKSEVSNA